jgi:hypothetical protein
VIPRCITSPVIIGTRVRWDRDKEKFCAMYDDQHGDGVVIGHKLRPALESMPDKVPAEMLIKVRHRNGYIHVAHHCWFKILPLPRNQSVVAAKK